MKTVDPRFGYAEVNVIETSDRRGLILSVHKHPVNLMTTLSADAARELVENILEVLEEIPDAPDHSVQTVMPFMAEEAA